MASGRAKRKRQYHQTPASIDIRVKVWKCLKVSAGIAASGIATFTAYVIMLLGYLTYLNPLPFLVSTTKSLFTRQRPRRMLTYKNYKAVTYKPSIIERFRNTVKSERSLKNELMKWLSTKLPPTIIIDDFRESWSNGVILCALIETVVPSTCPRYDLLKPENRVNNCRLGMTLVRKTLGIEEPMEPEDMSMPTRLTESKLLRYVQSIRYASMVPVETPSIKKAPWNREGAWPKKATFSEGVVDEERKQLMEADKIDCTASGSGLVMATIGKRAKFNVYTPKFITKSLYIHIKGPLGESVRRKIINHLPGGRPHRDDPDSSNMSTGSAEEGNTSSSASSGSGGIIPCDYQCVREGHYEVSYIAQSAGAYEITVTWGGEHIRNSPFNARASGGEKRSLPDTEPSDPSRVVCFRHENKRAGSGGAGDSQERSLEKSESNEVPLGAADSIEQEYAPKYNARTRRRQSFCRQSHVTSTLRESYESGGSTSPYDSRCSSVLMSSTERSMDSDVFYPYGGTSRASSFMNASRRGLISSSSSRSSMMSHRSSSILSSGGDRPGTVRTRRKVIKRTIRGAGGKEEIQYPSSADMSSMSNTSSFMGMSMSGFSPSYTPNDQSSMSGSLSISDDRLTTGMSSSTSTAPSPTVLAPVPNLVIAEREMHNFADHLAKRVLGNVMYEVSKKTALESGNSSVAASSGTRGHDTKNDEQEKKHNDSVRKLSFGFEPKNVDQSMSKDKGTHMTNSVQTQMNESCPRKDSHEESAVYSKVPQSPKFLDVSNAFEDVSNKPVESQITLEFEPQLGVDSSRNPKESSSNSSSATTSAETENMDEESGYSTLEDSLRSADQRLHMLMQVNNKDGGSAFEARGFRPVKPSVENHIDHNENHRLSNEHLHTPKPQRQSKNRRRADRQTQCTADDIKRETGWISRRSAFTKQKRREITESSMEQLKQSKVTSPQTTTTSPALSDTSDGREHVFQRKRLESKTPSIERNVAGIVRQPSTAKARTNSRSVARQSTFDSGYSDENGHILSLNGRDRSNSSSKNKTIRLNNDSVMANAVIPSSHQPTLPIKEKEGTTNAANGYKDQPDERKVYDSAGATRKRIQSGSESARNQLLSEKPRLGVDNMIEDEEIIAVTHRRPSFTAINFDLSHLQHVLDSQDQEQSLDLSPGPIKQIQNTSTTDNNPSHNGNHVSLLDTESSSVLSDKRDDVTDQASYDMPIAGSNVSSLYGGSNLTLKNNKEVPVSKLLASLDNDPDFTIREFLRKFMPSLGGNLMPTFTEDVLGKDADKLYPTLDALEQEMDSSWSELKSNIPSRTGADTNSKKSSRRHTPRVGTPFSAHSSSDSYFSSIRSSCCQAMGMGIHEGLVGVKNNFQVETSNAGEGSLAVFIRGPRPHTVCETSVTFTGDDLYEVVYEVNLAGFYVISVKWGDKHIPDSPFIVQISF